MDYCNKTLNMDQSKLSSFFGSSMVSSYPETKCTSKDVRANNIVNKQQLQ